jgi:hypothetical protein
MSGEFHGPRREREGRFGSRTEEVAPHSVGRLFSAPGSTGSKITGLANDTPVTRWVLFVVNSPKTRSPAAAGAFLWCAEYERQLEGGSPLSSLMAAKD